MRALLVLGVLALSGPAAAVPFADHGAVGVSTAKRAARARVVRQLDPATALDRSSVLSGPPASGTIVRGPVVRSLAFLPDLTECPIARAGFRLNSALTSAVSAVSMFRVSSSGGAVRITF